MAENERFVIKKVAKPKECDGCEYVFETCEITCPHNYGQGKTREEYEHMIAETLIKYKIKKSGRKLNEHTIGEIYDIRTVCNELAKAVCDALFGKSK